MALRMDWSVSRPELMTKLKALKLKKNPVPPVVQNHTCIQQILFPSSLYLHVMAFAFNVFIPVAATTVFATIFIVLRFLARRVTRVSLWWDDYMAVAAFFFALAWVAMVLICMFLFHHGCSASTLLTLV